MAIGYKKDKQTVYLLDLGGALKMPKSDSNVAPDDEFCGTAKYASIAAHSFKQVSMKDDLENWFYMIAEWFLEDGLPWKNINKVHEPDPEKRHEALAKAKKETLKSMSFYEELPPYYYVISRIIQEVEYGQTPLYDKIYELLDLALNWKTLTNIRKLDFDQTFIYHGPVPVPDANETAVYIKTDMSPDDSPHLQISHNGYTYKFYNPQAKMDTEKGLTKFRCSGKIKPNGKDCEARLKVSNYKPGVTQVNEIVKDPKLTAEHTCSPKIPRRK
jgi:hypothetical protein